MTLKSYIVGAAAIAVASGLAWVSGSAPVTAADHFDPPARVDATVTSTPELAGDIADLFMFQTPTTLVVALDFGGPQATTLPAYYDRDVLYTILLSNAGLRTDAEFTIDFKFAQDATNPNASGVRVAGVPGTTAPIIGPVETTIESNGVRVFAGLIDDPFNFDAVGLRQTRETGTLQFNRMRNRFAGMNSTVVVIEFPLSAIRNGTNPITAWATSARITR